MKLLLDMNCCHLKKALRELGYDCVSVYELLQQRISIRSDYAMIQYAKAEGLVIITADEEVIDGAEETGDYECVRVQPFSQEMQVDLLHKTLQRRLEKYG